MLKDFTQEKFDIIIQAGQSNSEGRGFGDTDNPYVPSEMVWYMNQDFTMSWAQEKVRGNEIESTYALSFAREYLNQGLLEKGRKLLILRCALGGTGFLNNYWKMTDDLYLGMMEMIRTAVSLNQENRLVGFLWHQGETDAELWPQETNVVENEYYEVHYNYLKALLDSVEKEFQVPDIPFIAGDFVHDWKNENIEICTPVVTAVRSVCETCGHGAFVETDGLLSNRQELHRNPLGWDDGIHFSRKSVYILGERYFDAFLRLKRMNQPL